MHRGVRSGRVAWRVHNSVREKISANDGTLERTQMKKTLIAITCGLMLVVTATRSEAIALQIGDDRYLGTVDPGNGSPADEAALLNTLAGIASPGGTTTIGGVAYFRDDNVL